MQIDRLPPSPTGDTKADIQAMSDYMAYLQEQFNYIITVLTRGEGNG